MGLEVLDKCIQVIAKCYRLFIVSPPENENVSYICTRTVSLPSTACQKKMQPVCGSAFGLFE